MVPNNCRHKQQKRGVEEGLLFIHCFFHSDQSKLFIGFVVEKNNVMACGILGEWKQEGKIEYYY